MTEAAYAHNHQVDPATGFLQSPGFINAFDAERKTQFLDLWKANGLALYRTCKQMGLSVDTVNRNYHVDQAFKEAYDQVQREYIDELEATSRTNALVPKMVIERIFQLKSLLPGKYGDQKSSNIPQIVINIDGKMIEHSRTRDKVIEAKIVEDQQKRVLEIEAMTKASDNSTGTSDSNRSLSSNAVDNQPL